MKEFEFPNVPLNTSALDALEAMTGHAPEDIRRQVLAAPFDDDLSRLRLFADPLASTDPYQWSECPQPKRMIGDYVENNGFNVPRRYESLDEALDAVHRGKAVLLRSEHPLEYAAFSGLLESYHISEEALRREANFVCKLISAGANEEDILDLTKRNGLSKKPIRRYLTLAGKGVDEYHEECHFHSGSTSRGAIWRL